MGKYFNYLEDWRLLKPTQAGLRAYGQLPGLINEVERGKVFNDPDKPKILLSVFPAKDPSIYIHNGHHRAVACFLAGRKLLPEEVEFVEWPDHSSYEEFNWEVGFITPFKIRIEARLADLTPFRKAVDIAKIHYTNEGLTSVALTERLQEFILRNAWLYKCYKTVDSVEDLAILSLAGVTSQVTDYRVR